MVKIVKKSKKIQKLLLTAFPNHEDMLTDGLGGLIVFFYAIAFVMLLPFILANKWFYIVDFQNRVSCQF